MGKALPFFLGFDLRFFLPILDDQLFNIEFHNFSGDFDGMLCSYRLKCPEGLCSSSAHLGKLL